MATDVDATDLELNDPETPEQPPTPSAAAEADSEKPADDDAKSSRRQLSPVRRAILASLVIALALGGVVGWLGFRTHQSRQQQADRELFLQIGQQGAVNLTTIDWRNVDRDIQRVLDSATGTFYDDFSQRSQPFIDIVKKVQSTSVGTVTAAGLETMSDDDAQVLVAVSVTTTNSGAADLPPQGWRMRIDVTKVAGGAKVSGVTFVPA